MLKLFTGVALLTLLSLPFISKGQSGGSVTGRITSINNQPIELVSVSLVQLRKGTLTNNDGTYQITNADPGKYTLRIQMLGARETDLPVEIIAGQTAILNYQLTKENIQVLQEIRIVGN